VKSKSGKLSDKRLLKAAHNMELTMAAIVDKLQEKFFDESEVEVEHLSPKGDVTYVERRPKVADKTKLGIANFFARTLAMKDRVEDDLGLREKTSAQSDNPLIIALGGNVAIFKSLPADQRQKLLLKVARGERIEKVG